MFYSLKIVEDQKLIGKYGVHSKRKILRILRTIKWVNNGMKVGLRVNYGRGFFNEGDYNNEKDLWFAFKAFTETD